MLRAMPRCYGVVPAPCCRLSPRQIAPFAMPPFSPPIDIAAAAIDSFRCLMLAAMPLRRRSPADFRRAFAAAVMARCLCAIAISPLPFSSPPCCRHYAIIAISFTPLSLISLLHDSHFTLSLPPWLSAAATPPFQLIAAAATPDFHFELPF
jgi:hypothetical protein